MGTLPLFDLAFVGMLEVSSLVGPVNVIEYRLLESVTKVGDVLHYATDICTFPEVNLSALWFWSMGCKCIIENNIVVADTD